ncbi:uncharacterized protein LOC127736395 [Mytilus californianus]|uniref:uncharacterized protein LOC127736395 n=1 Tax=Mytilus californianus TaxID=6549 RepID=UPI002245DDB5|nr:uncharacterized protein LOC127736395 [Mytilus californianus]
MALSLSEAQSPLSCQLCDTPAVIKWRCKDCVLLMCDNCKERIHPKFKSAETHVIVSLKDVGKEDSDISAQFGSLQISKPVISSVVSTYMTSLPAICQMQYNPGNDTLFCSYYLDDSTYAYFNIRLLKESVKVLQSFNIECMDFALNSKGNIYFAQNPSFVLNVLSSDGVIKTIFSLSHMVILGIHINKSNEIILGLREQGPPFPVKTCSTRQIAIFGAKNERKLTIEYDQKGRKLFSYIWRISTDSDNNIYAIDQFEKFDGRLVALETCGRAKFIYKGHSSINTSRKPFNPMGIVITKTNIIIVSDKNNNALHALNTKGEVIGIQTVTTLGIKRPRSLCLDSEGFLLIGCYTSTSNAKIHAAKITL